MLPRLGLVRLGSAASGFSKLGIVSQAKPNKSRLPLVARCGCGSASSSYLFLETIYILQAGVHAKGMGKELGVQPPKGD